jgi:hypothetical protein
MRSTLLPAALAWVCCALLAGCDGGSDDDGGGPEVPPRTATPQEMVGAWKLGAASFTNFWGNQNQYFGTEGGTSVYWNFESDGDYKQQVYINRRKDGCLIETWTETVGTTTFDGNRFTIYPGTGRYKAADTCIDRNNFDRPMTDQERRDFVKTFLWKFETDPQDGKLYMMVGFDEDTWSRFSPYGGG